MWKRHLSKYDTSEQCPLVGQVEHSGKLERRAHTIFDMIETLSNASSVAKKRMSI